MFYKQSSKPIHDNKKQMVLGSLYVTKGKSFDVFKLR